MTDLREKIAAAVARELVRQAQDCGEYQTRDCYKVADAVIAELGECDDDYDPYEEKADAERQQWADDEGIPR